MQSYKQFAEEMNNTRYQFTEEELVEIYNSIDTATFNHIANANVHYYNLEKETFGNHDDRYHVTEKVNIAKHFEFHMAEEDDFMEWIRQDKIKGNHLNMKLYYFENTNTYGEAFGCGDQDMDW